MKAINIVIVDDHQILLEALSSLLSSLSEIHVAGTASSGEEALTILANNNVDVVITDINMPGMNGMELTKEIKKKFPQIKVLALTMHNEGRNISAMLKNGASGYILKNTGNEELLLAVKALAAGGIFFSEKVKSIMMESMMPGKKTNLNDSLIELTERETEVLKLIAEEFTQEQIAAKLFISTHTVISHRRKLLYKFDVKNTAGLIKAAMEKGFL